MHYLDDFDGPGQDLGTSDPKGCGTAGLIFAVITILAAAAMLLCSCSPYISAKRNPTGTPVKREAWRR